MHKVDSMTAMSQVSLEDILNNFASSFEKKAPVGLSLISQIDVLPQRNSWHVNVRPGRQVTVAKGPHKDSMFIFTVTEILLRQIHSGRITALTASAKARGSDPALLEFTPGKGVR